jgi:AAA+ ATPase superfamily predicted ATPase
MNRQAAKDALQKQIQNIRSELSQISLTHHTLSGLKQWRVTSSNTEKREKELKTSIEEYQRILQYAFK